MTFTTRHERKTCRRCGGHYMTGEYRDHVRGLAHIRQLDNNRRIAKKKAAEEAAWRPA